MKDNSNNQCSHMHNQKVWDELSNIDCEWSKPVSAEVIHNARNGKWDVRLMHDPLPEGWLPDVKNLKILCLASAGGQQAPVLAAAGAEVTVFDISDNQLDKDRMVAEREQLDLKIVQGDMRDLSAFPNEFFDCIFNPVSNLYIPHVQPVWNESYRVLKNGGRLLSSFYNPVLFVGDRDPEYTKNGLIKPRYKIPFSDLTDHDEETIRLKKEKNQALTFGHSLSQLINGQLEAGFMLKGFHESSSPVSRFLIEDYIPGFLATYAVKYE